MAEIDGPKVCVGRFDFNYEYLICGGTQLSKLTLTEGAGSFVFRYDGAVPSPRSMRVFSFCPRSSSRHTRIVVAMHGVDRAAAEFRDLLAPQAERNGQIVLVPEFDPDQFPGVHAYNF